MKSTLIRSFTICLLGIFFLSTSCTKDKAGNVLISFRNDSGHDLKNVQVSGRKIGDLKIGQQTKIIVFPAFVFDSNTPVETVTAKINGEKTKTITGTLECGTMIKTVKEGAFEMKITQRMSEDDVFLELYNL